MGRKLTYANVMSTLCFFLLLGGGAYAAGHLGKNTVGPKQLKKNAVITAKIKKEAITAAKVKKGTLTGTQINLSTLGTVPKAESANSAAVASSLPRPNRGMRWVLRVSRPFSKAGKMRVLTRSLLPASTKISSELFA